LLTVVPFYHGGSIYLLKNYIHANPPKKKGVGLNDFLTLSFEGVVFYAIADSIKNLAGFEFWFTILLILDVVWVGFAYLTSNQGKEPTPKFWIISKGIMILFFVVITGINASDWSQSYLCIFLAAFIRTAADYALCYDYYFPGSKSKQAKVTDY